MISKVKQIALLILVLSGASICCQQAYAQDQKIGYFDSDFILSNLPEYNGLEQQLELIAGQWRTELEQMQRELQQLEEDFEAKEILYTPEIRKQKQNEIQQKINDIRFFREQKFGPDGEYFQRQAELLEPIQRQVFEAVQAVAVRNGYDLIFDRAGDVRLIYARNEWNIDEEILIELGIDINEISN